ncbi:hypothetical protein [Listeria monocytogenes]|uniref:hypothetical protein n=1 Tax=Listeria monocytogenes TaxID=1639 RepID=UPI00127D11C6|nr:hypothetical protein [Listeria monocytogenes]EAG5528574.1 hypothetical protein [Listeria monocytogenes]EHD5880633.1 hypothetical protein [Listeria monocytogenes]EHT7835946.1 hypothetical protein [Listeria monocytogenes]EJS5927232.1 hypothetical protein [Listeria monocytogenes]EJS5999970.1 hypothetical protein [Listeria monocytogenes]
MLSVCRSKYTKSDLCKNQEFLESQKKGYSDPTYDYKAGYPRPHEAWAFDANGNIDKEKSAEVSEKIGEWSTYVLMLVIPGPEELLITGILVKVGGKVGPKIISWGANKFGAKGASVVDDIFKQGKKVVDKFNIDDAYVKPKHLSTTKGNGAKFLGDSKAEAEVILKDAMKNGTVQSITDNGLTKMGQQSYSVIIDARKTIGTKGENLIKVVLSEDGGMLSSYPVK